jgi:zinc/manganese transport system permease protein
MGDAMSHAILPGLAIAYATFGMSVWAMSLFGFIAGLLIALIAGLIKRSDGSHLTALYLMALALGVALMSRSSGGMDLTHILFGQIFSIDEHTWWVLGFSLAISFFVLRVYHHKLMINSIDPLWGKYKGHHLKQDEMILISLLVLNLIAGVQAMGTLMTIGLMMLPAITARLFAKSVPQMIGCALGISYLSITFGILISFYWDFLPGPSMIMVSGLLFWYVYMIKVLKHSLS